jgi:hypothetical protein
VKTTLLAAYGTVVLLTSISLGQAQNISLLDTGAGLYAENNGAVLVDPNWKVSLLSTNPPGQTPPAGIPNGNAYLVPNPLFTSYVGYPINTSWAPNDTTSTWLTYSTPTYLGGDSADEVFQYEMSFKALSSGEIGINFISDNYSKLYVNGQYLGANSSINSFAYWLSTPLQLAVTAGNVYTVDLEVENIVLLDDNPTGGRVEFTGNVNAVAVPEPSCLWIGLGLPLISLFCRRIA